MKITVNGRSEKFSEELNLARLIERFEKRDVVHLIVEHNGKFVYPQDYESVAVHDGDRIEFVIPDFGG
jgi:thiamine biosynthesis protein ThiS